MIGVRVLSFGQHVIPALPSLQVDADLRVGPEAAPDGPVLTSSLRMRCNSIHTAYTRKHSHNTHTHTTRKRYVHTACKVAYA